MSSAFYNDEVVQTIKDAVGVVEVVGEYVNLKKLGVNYKGLCPFHSEKTPSFTVNPARNSFHCFGCGEGGDVLAFIMKYHNMQFPEALKQLADRANITLPEKPLSQKEQQTAEKRKVLYEINEKAVEVYHRFLLDEPAGAPARKYLRDRGIPAEVIESYQLGYAPESWDFLLKKLDGYAVQDVEEAGLVVPNDRGGHYDRFRHRVLFPILNASGRALGFGGRILGDGQPKYLNSPESPIYNKSSILFGLFQNKDAIRREKRCLLVEGNFDLLSLVSNGIANVTAPLGTALTTQQVKSLKGYATEAIILFDGDQAGVKAALRAVPIFLSEQLPAKVVMLPKNHDPDTFISEFGKQRLEDLLDKAQPLPEFVFDRLLVTHGLSLAGKSAIVSDLKPIIDSIGDNHLQQTLFVSHFSQKLGLTPEQMLKGLPTPVPTKTAPKKAETIKGRGKADFSKIEEQLLGFLIVYPEFLNSFNEAGLEWAITSGSGKVVWHHLMKLAEDENAGTEVLLEKVCGAERDFISDRIINVPDISDQGRDEEASEKISWIKENALKVRMKNLTAQINQAQQDNDHERLMELLTEKNTLR